MKQTTNFLLLAFCLLLINITPTKGQHLGLGYDQDVATLLVEYDNRFMKKMEYHVDEGFIVDDHHVKYLLPLDEHRTLIFKVMHDSEVDMQDIPYTVFDNDIAHKINEYFIVRVNEGHTHLYLRDGAKTLKVDKVVFIEETDDYVGYFAYPFQSFYYAYTDVYAPGEELMPIVFDDFRYDAHIYHYGETEEQGHEKHLFLKLYRDVCYKRPYGVVTPRTVVGEVNPMTQVISPTTKKQIFRECQHNLQFEYIPKLGMVREFYIEQGHQFGSQLTHIDGVPLKHYLATFSTDNGYIEAQPLSKAYAAATTAKTIERNKHKINSTLTPNNKIVEIAADFQPLAPVPVTTYNQKTIKKAPAKIGNGTATPRPSVESSRDVHIVKEGDTLYRLSKKYGTSVKALQRMNNLESTIIEVEQPLIIREAIAN